jgi:hypothetical protein
MSKENESNKNNFQQLMILQDDDLTTDEYEFASLHRQIIYNGNMAQDFAIRMAQDLKRMRDGRVYEAAGFKDFGEYVENAVGMKERQAYYYIKVIEDLPEKFLQSNANLGISKLILLSGATNSEREEIVAGNDVESMTVKELKAKLAERDKQQEQLQIELDERTDKWEAEKKELIDDIDALNELRSDEAGDMQRAINDAVAKATETQRAEQTKAEEAAKKAKEEAKRLKNEIETLKKAPKEKETVDNPATTAKLAEVENALNLKNAEIEALNKKIAVESNAAKTEFKVKCGLMQTILSDLQKIIAASDEEQAAKYRNAIKRVLEAYGL